MTVSLAFLKILTIIKFKNIFIVIIFFILQVCLYDLSYDALIYSRTLVKQDGRILSLSWHPTAPRIAMGCADSTLRVVNTETNRSILRITMDKNSNEENTLVWSVKFLSDDTIVSGSSLGSISFWNSKYGTLKQSFSLHNADLLSIAVNNEEDILFAAGVDHKIVRLKKVEKRGEGEVESYFWVQACDVRPHTHDVRSLAVSRNGVLSSGGVDTVLCFNKVEEFEKEMSLRQSPFASWNDRFQLAPLGNILLFCDSRSLKLWKITPQSVSTDHSSSTVCSPDKDALAKSGLMTHKEMESDLFKASGLPVLLLEIKSPSTHHIVCSGISDDGRLVAFSDSEKFWVYSLEPKVTCISTQCLPSRAIAIFSNNSSINSNTSIAICPFDGGIKIASAPSPVTKDGVVFTDMEIRKKKMSTRLYIKLKYSPDGKYLLAMSEKYRVLIFETTNGTLFATLPRFDNTFPPSLSFTASSESLLIFTSGDREFYKYNLKKSKLKDLGRPFLKDIAMRVCSRKGLSMTLGLNTLPTLHGLCMIYDWDRLLFVRYEAKGKHKEDKEEEEVIGKKRSLGMKELSSHCVQDYRDIVYAGVLDCGEMVLVEKPWRDRVTALPPTLKIDKYGQ